MDAGNHKTRGEDGFTLVELLIATSMILVVFFAALGLFEIAQRSEPEISSRNSKIQAAQVGIERVSRELRQTTEVITASPSTLVVETYVNRTSCGGSTLGSARLCQVTYSCSSATCTRRAADVGGANPGTTEIIAEDLISPNVFGYTSTGGTISAISIGFAVRDEEGSSEDAITLNSGVVLRNVSQAPEPL